MTYKLTIDQKPTYLHAIVKGENNRENVTSYLGDIHRECARRGCYRVLIEERLDGPRLGTIDIFQIASEGSSKGKGFFRAVAYVDVNAETKSMEFAETVAVNRALPVAVFATVAEAEQWLVKQSRDDAEPKTAVNGEKPGR